MLNVYSNPQISLYTHNAIHSRDTAGQHIDSLSTTYTAFLIQLLTTPSHE